MNELAQHHAQHFLELAERAEPELWAQNTDAAAPATGPRRRHRLASAGPSERKRGLPCALASALYPFWEIRARHGEASS